jgi:hypothetical protein
MLAKAPSAPHRFSDLRFLPEDHSRGEIVDHKRQFMFALAPVGWAENSANARSRQQTLEHPERVLSKPKHPTALPQPLCLQRIGQAIDPCIELRPGQAHLAIDHRIEQGPGTTMLIQYIGKPVLTDLREGRQ